MGYESVAGCDAAGYVESVGEGVDGFAKGDRVAAFTRVTGGDRTGTYAEYTVAPANTTFKIADKTSFEGESVFTLDLQPRFCCSPHFSRV